MLPHLTAPNQYGNICYPTLRFRPTLIPSRGTSDSEAGLLRPWRATSDGANSASEVLSLFYRPSYLYSHLTRSRINARLEPFLAVHTWQRSKMQCGRMSQILARVAAFAEHAPAVPKPMGHHSAKYRTVSYRGELVKCLNQYYSTLHDVVCLVNYMFSCYSSSYRHVCTSALCGKLRVRG